MQINQKKTKFFLLTLLFPLTLQAGEPVYLISDTFAKSEILVVYGFPDNKTPCESIKKFTNEQMVIEKNDRRFYCTGYDEAKEIACELSKTKRIECEQKFDTRHELLRELFEYEWN